MGLLLRCRVAAPARSLTRPPPHPPAPRRACVACAQDSHLFALLLRHGHSVESVAGLFVASFSVSYAWGLLGAYLPGGGASFLGGRRNSCLACLGLYALAAATVFHDDYHTLLLGRFFYGSATALLHTVFDAWMAASHAHHAFPDDWLVQTYQLVRRATRDMREARLGNACAGHFMRACVLRLPWTARMARTTAFAPPPPSPPFSALSPSCLLRGSGVPVHGGGVGGVGRGSGGVRGHQGPRRALPCVAHSLRARRVAHQPHLARQPAGGPPAVRTRVRGLMVVVLMLLLACTLVY